MTKFYTKKELCWEMLTGPENTVTLMVQILIFKRIHASVISLQIVGPYPSLRKWEMLL